MKYYKNTELANLHRVSEKSVRNWIRSAKEGNLSLELCEVNGKNFVANTTQNTTKIEELVQSGRKFKNTRGLKTTSPKPEFYDFFTQKQILDIISNLDIHREVPVQYSYVDGGAELWDRYAGRLIEENNPNILNQTIELLDVSADNLEKLIDDDKKVNVVDLGPGNGLPIKSTVERLVDQGRLNRYIAIDISKEMLDILERNFNEWFGDKVKVENYVRDISYERFNDLLADDPEANNSVNLVFLIGGTLSNFRAPNQLVENINNSMGPSDLLISTGYLDTVQTRRFFDFQTKSTTIPKSELILDFMNISRDLFTQEFRFVEHKRAREGGVKLNVDLLIKFKLPKGERTVQLYKNDFLLLWRYWHRGIVDLVNFFERNEFEFLFSSKSKDRNYFLMVNKVRVSQERF